MPRFVLLFHDCPPSYERPSHWDFMLEQDALLRTWAISELPAAWHAACEKVASSQQTKLPGATGDTVEARALGDHRLAYLDFEGPLSGNRGRVVRIDAGTFRLLDKTSQTPNCLHVELSGLLLSGAATLMRSEADSEQWTLTVDATV
jgi:hypothetical protein